MFTHIIFTRVSYVILFVMCSICLVACASFPRPVPSYDVIRRDILVQESFDTSGGWDLYDAEGLRLQIAEGVFRATVNGGQYIYSLSDTQAGDVSLDIESQFLGGDPQSGYGVICRANPAIQGSGYYFIISADGAFTIRRGQGREVQSVVAWSRTNAIRTGAETNTIRAVCVDDYLALYINGEFVAEARDSLYSAGYAGVVVVGRVNKTLDVQFDNLFVWSAE